MLSEDEKAFVEETAQATPKFGMISHAVTLSRIINGLGGNQVTPKYIFNEMHAADVDVNQCIREIKS